MRQRNLRRAGSLRALCCCATDHLWTQLLKEAVLWGERGELL